MFDSLVVPNGWLYGCLDGWLKGLTRCLIIKSGYAGQV